MGDRWIWSLRLRCALTTAAAIAASRWAWPEPDVWTERSTAALMSLGYAHFAGGLLASRRRVASWAPAGVEPRLFAACMLCGVAAVFAALVAGLRSHGLAVWWPLFQPLLGLAFWHVAENEQAVARLPRRARFDPPPLARDVDGHVAAIGVACALLAVAVGCLRTGSSLGLPEDGDNAPLRWAATACGTWLWLRGAPRGRGIPGLILAAVGLGLPSRIEAFSFEALFHVCMLYHFAAWAWLFVDRARERPRERWTIALRLMGLHTGACALAAVAFLPGPGAESVRAVLFEPTLYLFWSLAHILQTTTLRWIAAPVDGGR